MTEQEMSEKSFERPRNYFALSGKEQWAIDKSLGILDWVGDHMTDEELKRYRAHYSLSPKRSR